MLSNFKSRLLFRLRYLVTPPWDSGISPPELIAFIEDNPPSKALDLGCGTGTNAITLAQHGWQVRGIDFISKAIRTGKKKAKQAGVQVDLLVGDVTNPNLVKGQYDLVLDIGCYHALNPNRRAAYLNNLLNVLAPGGTFLWYGFINQTPDQTRISEQDIKAFSKRFKLVDRKNGDDRGRPSTWFWFKANSQD